MSRFGRLSRLRGGTEFGQVLRRGRRLSGSLFGVCVWPNALGRARLGMVVTKRVEPLSVRRNHAKRLIRECFRRHQANLAGSDVVVQLRVSLEPGKGRSAASEELQRLFERAGACRG